MRINTLGQIKTGMIASALALATVSCSNRDIVNKEKEEALKYIPQLGVVDAERTSCFYSATGTSPELAQKVVYWDSIASEIKIQNAYQSGKEFAIKRHNGEKVTPTRYSYNLNDRSIEQKGLSILNNIRTTLCWKKPAKEWLKLRENEPDMSYNSSSTPSEIIFWRGISTAHKCREAFKNGVQFVKDSIANVKDSLINTQQTPTTNKQVYKEKRFIRTNISQI